MIGVSLLQKFIVLPLAAALTVFTFGYAPVVRAQESGDAEALRARFGVLADQLKNNQFQRPIYLDSVESASSLKGNIYAVVSHPFAGVNAALSVPANWCDMLILHLNTKHCRATNEGGTNGLQVSIGKKLDQPLEDAYQVNFTFSVVASTPEYMNIALNARDGPMGTSDYRILLEAVPLPDGRTFIHLTYSYAYGVAARIAMKAYLSTVGSNKVGFTRIGKTSVEGEDYIKGVRGVVERNTMRYYLAIDAYLSGLKVPASEQLDRRLQAWFAGTERYPRQLREVEKNDYMQMKRKEYARQQSMR